MKFGSAIKRGQLLFIGSFLALVALGTLLLKLPLTTHNGAPVSWEDALFMATSASCVTGLATVTLSGFNYFGQMVLLALIQIGGLGVMSFSAFAVFFLGRKFNYSNALILSKINDNFSRRDIEFLLKAILSYTAGIELAGWLLLVPGFMICNGMGFGQAFYYGFFHSISAFCNAGLSQFDESMVGQSAYVKMVIAALIFSGGLGIYVVCDVFHNRRARHYTVYTKLVLITTFVLVIGGGLSIAWSQRGSDMGWVDVLFTAVSARTAGFNSVPMEQLSSSSLAIIIVLMMIGGAPGSTGGGIRVTSVALAFTAVINTLKGNTRLVLFHREIPVENVLKAFTMIIIYTVLAVLGTIMMSAFSRADLEKTTFETVSALGTVGLSSGISMAAHTTVKLLLSLLMFIGRIGPFTLFLFLLGREKESLLKYPEERIIIG